MAHRWGFYRLRWHHRRLWLVKSCVDRGCSAEVERPLW